MSSYKPFTLLAALIFLIFAGLNLYRLLFGFEILIAGERVGVTISLLLMAASLAISAILFRESRTIARP